MRKIQSEQITAAVRELFIQANYILPRDIKSRLKEYGEREENPRAARLLSVISENADIAERESIPICQDTGMAVIFAEIGQDVFIEGALFSDAVNEGVRQAYERGYLRKSVVNDPFERINTQDNTPAVIYTELVPGDKIKLTALPKGFGSENMSRQKMFTPAATEEDIIAFVAETARLAGGNPCPPSVIGVGIGGTFDYSCVLAKKALCRPLGSSEGKTAALEKRMLDAVNATGVGVQGLGGKTTAIGINIELFPTHIASLPVAVNMSCHASRHAFTVI